MVLVSHVFRSLQESEVNARSLSLAGFKQLLLEAHRAGHLDLAGADMPQTLPAQDLEASLVQYGPASFYFVRV
jgi:hypothetical protein